MVQATDGPSKDGWSSNSSLVGGDWNMTFIFPYIENFIIPIDFHIFQRGRSTTNQEYLKLGICGRFADLDHDMTSGYIWIPFADLDHDNT